MAGKAGTYVLRPQAEVDLEGIWLYTVEHWSVQQADKYYRDILAAIKHLAFGRVIGRTVNIRDGYFKFAVGSHFIFYRINGTVYDIVRILHQQQDAERHLYPTI